MEILGAHGTFLFMPQAATPGQGPSRTLCHAGCPLPLLDSILTLLVQGLGLPCGWDSGLHCPWDRTPGFWWPDTKVWEQEMCPVEGRPGLTGVRQSQLRSRGQDERPQKEELEE